MSVASGSSVSRKPRSQARRALPTLFAILALFTLSSGRASGAETPKDSLAAHLIQPAALAHWLAGPAAQRPALIHVGFGVLYKGGHIPGSRYAGPASKPEGLDSLRKTLGPLPREAPLVLYCGCCPWENCPNVVPAFQTARAMGFKRVQVLLVAKDFQKDWADKGYPTAESTH